MKCDTLIQNVSAQCIPNLVAAETFHPKRIIWIYSEETQEILQRLKKATQPQVPHQEAWQVDVRNSDAMQQALKRRFQALNTQGALVYHLTCGTKAMAVQTVMQLAAYKQLNHAEVSAVVMDPRTQSFDILFPSAKNDAVACELLSLEDVLKVHGSWRKQASGRDMGTLRKAYEPLQALRQLHPMLMQAVKGRVICSAEEAEQGYFLRGGDDLPHEVQQALHLAQDAGAIKSLSIKGNRFFFQPAYSDNPFAYVRNMWMEDWVGSVLARYDDGAWRGGFTSVKVCIQEEADYQEFDFLGARKNHLVYWSCKNTGKFEVSQMFEVDALRDEVGGRDFHIAGLVHTAKVASGLRQKAKRLGVNLVHILDDNAEETLVHLSCGSC